MIIIFCRRCCYQAFSTYRTLGVVQSDTADAGVCGNGELQVGANRQEFQGAGQVRLDLLGRAVVADDPVLARSDLAASSSLIGSMERMNGLVRRKNSRTVVSLVVERAVVEMMRTRRGDEHRVRVSFIWSPGQC